MRAIGLALACWGSVFALVALGLGGAGSALTPVGLLLCILLVLGPTALALPAGRVLGAPLWAVETIVAWSFLGYLLVLVDPSVLGHGLAFLLLLPACYGAFASPGLLLAAWLAPARAAVIRRQGYLLAALPGGVLVLRALDALAPLTALLFGLLLLSTQVLFMASLRRPQPADLTAAPAERAVETLPAPAPVAVPREAPVPLRPVIAIAARGRLD
jgi:hypothetical protein